MKEQFCSYEIALKLKELGFDEGCLAVYYHAGKQLFIIHQSFGTDIDTINYSDYMRCTAPLWQQVIDWLKSNHNIMVTQSPSLILEHWFVSDINGFKGSYPKEQAILKGIELCENKK